MTGNTRAQEALIERIMEIAADPTIKVIGIFEGMPTGYLIRDPISTAGVLEFQTASGSTIRVREDTLVGIIEDKA